MSYWILPVSGIPVSATTVQRVTNLERQTEEFKSKMTRNFNNGIASKWTTTTSNVIHEIKGIHSNQLLSLEDEDEQFMKEFSRVINNQDIKDIDDLTTQEIGIQDPYLGMELGMVRNGEMGVQNAVVKRRNVDEEG